VGEALGQLGRPGGRLGDRVTFGGGEVEAVELGDDLLRRLRAEDTCEYDPVGATVVWECEKRAGGELPVDLPRQAEVYHGFESGDRVGLVGEQPELVAEASAADGVEGAVGDGLLGQLACVRRDGEVEAGGVSRQPQQACRVVEEARVVEDREPACLDVIQRAISGDQFAGPPAGQSQGDRVDGEVAAPEVGVDASRSDVRQSARMCIGLAAGAREVVTDARSPGAARAELRLGGLGLADLRRQLGGVAFNGQIHVDELTVEDQVTNGAADEIDLTRKGIDQWSNLSDWSEPVDTGMKLVVCADVHRRIFAYGYPRCPMRFPRTNRKTWLLAGVLVVVAAVVAAYAITQLGKPSNTVNNSVAFNTTTTKTTITKVVKVNNFTVPFYGNGDTRTRQFISARALNDPSKLKLAWTLGGNALLEFPATIWGNNLYLMDDGATVKRINISTGKVIWKRHMGTCRGCGLSASTPSLDVAHKMLFVSVLSLKGRTIGATGGELGAVSMLNGHLLWRFSVPPGTESSPMIVGNSVYFGDQNGTEYSLNIHTGRENWHFTTGGSIKGGAVYYGGNLYFGNYAGSFYAVNARTGKQVWSTSPGGQFYSTPAEAYGRIYVGNNNGAAYSFSVRDGATAWSRTLGGYVYSGPAVATIPGLGPTVFIGSYDGNLYALNAQDGSVRWTAPVPSSKQPGISGSATVVNNVVYASTVYSPGSFGFNVKTGKRVWHYPDGSYTTVIADQNALFLMGKYVLYKFDQTGR